MKIANSWGKEWDFQAVVNLMDDELREELHSEIAPCSDQKFYIEYCKRHEEKFGERFVFEEENPQV